MAARDSRGIVLRSDDDEVVVHHLAPLDAVALIDELQLCRRVVHQQYVGVAVAAHLQGLSGAARNDPHLDAGLCREHGQDVLEQAGIVGGRRRGEYDKALARERGCRAEHECRSQ